MELSSGMAKHPCVCLTTTDFSKKSEKEKRKEEQEQIEIALFSFVSTKFLSQIKFTNLRSSIVAAQILILFAKIGL